MSTNNMPDFFDNILDDAGPIGELPDLDQVPEFVDESNLSPPAQNEQTSHATAKPNLEEVLTDHGEKPILVNPSNGGILDKFDGEVLSDDFPTFDFDSTIKERDDQDIAFERALNGANDSGIEGELFHSDGEKLNADASIANVHTNIHSQKDLRAFSDLSCEENERSMNGAVKRRKPAGRKSKASASRPSPAKKARVEPVRNVTNRVSDVTSSSATNRVSPASEANHRNSPSFQKMFRREVIRHPHLNNGSPMAVPGQPLQMNVPNNGVRMAPITHNKPPGLTLAPHTHSAQERNPLAPQDLLFPASPLGMLPGDVRDQLLNQARRQSYATAEMRAILIAQEAASNIYTQPSNGKANSTNKTVPIPQAGIQAMQQASMQPVARMGGAHPRAGPHITQNALNLSRQPSLHVTPSQQQVISNPAPVTPQMQSAQMHAASGASRQQSAPFSRVSSTDSHAKQLLLQQHPVAMGLSGQINTPNGKLPLNGDRRRLISNNGLKQTFSQQAPYPIIDTKLAAMNGIPAIGPSGVRRLSNQVRDSEAVAQTLANTYDQVYKLSASTTPRRKTSRKTQPLNCEQMTAPSSQAVSAPQIQQTPQQQVQPEAVAPITTPAAAEHTTPATATAGLTAAAVRRQLSQNRNGPRLRFSKNAGPSKYCHICGRSASTVGVAVCGNLPLGLCRKVLCDKCLLINEPEKLEMAKTKNSGWTCTHCRNCCPPKARCHQYTRNNQKRREKNKQKKRLKKQQQQQQEQERLEQENKRIRGSSSKQPEEHAQGISPTGVPDGAFG